MLDRQEKELHPLRVVDAQRTAPHGAERDQEDLRQEQNIATCNLARMNMLLHGVKDTEFCNSK